MKKHKPKPSALRDGASAGSPKTTCSANLVISEDRIRLRAYELYQARGGAPGYELEDWLLAESELKTGLIQRSQPGSGATPNAPASPD